MNRYLVGNICTIHHCIQLGIGPGRHIIQMDHVRAGTYTMMHFSFNSKKYLHVQNSWNSYFNEDIGIALHLPAHQKCQFLTHRSFLRWHLNLQIRSMTRAHIHHEVNNNTILQYFLFEWLYKGKLLVLMKQRELTVKLICMYIFIPPKKWKGFRSSF